MPKTLKQLSLSARSDWRKWLIRYHESSPGVWLIFWKKHTGRPCIAYEAAVEEALCFGWIDSLVKRLDENRYRRKFTPRSPTSTWSASNRKRVRKLAREGFMTPAGAALVAAAKSSGRWDLGSASERSPELPNELQLVLAENAEARAFLEGMPPSHRRRYLGWVAAAKRPETRERRAREALALLVRGEYLGMK